MKTLWEHEMELENLIYVYKKMVKGYSSKESIDKQWQLILDEQEFINTNFTQSL